MRILIPFRTILLLAAALAVPALAAGHVPGISFLDVVQSQPVSVRATFSRADIDTLADASSDRMLYELAASSLRARVDGEPAAIRTISVRRAETDEAIHFLLELPSGAEGTVELDSMLLPLLSRGHRQFASVRTDDGSLVDTRLLDAGRPTLTLTTSSDAFRPSFRDFVLSGAEHIVIGYDHVLFLVALLVTSQSLLQVVKVVSAFTLAHSITLTLSVLGLFRLPSALVEPLIAASIVYVALDNLRGRSAAHRWRLSFGFGLIHGLGLASALAGLGGAERWLPLAAFNVGVELGQMAIVAVVLPAILWLRASTTRFPQLSTAASSVVLLAGAYWLVERTLLS